MICKLQETDGVKELFRGAGDTCILSCLQNIMGSIYVWRDDTADAHGEIRSAVAMLGDFSYWAGAPDENLLLCAPVYGDNRFSIMVPLNDAWAEQIRRTYGDSAEKVTRYALTVDPSEFDREKLAAFADDVPPDYVVREINESLYDFCGRQEWCRDFVGNYESYAHFKKYGLGYVLIKDGDVLAGASSFSGYRDGIEIEIVTRADYRRRGFARICAANLILECLSRGLYPSWDAANTNSLALAQQLGYRLTGKYFAFERHGDDFQGKTGDIKKEN